MRHRVKEWSQPFLSPDRKSLWIRVNLDNGDGADLELPFERADELVAAFARAGEHASNESGDDPNVKPDFSRAQWETIPVRGLGFATGRHAGETILVVDLFRFQLALALDSRKVADLGQRFARMAATLSADPSRPS